MKKKLVKTRNIRKDTLEAMKNCECKCNNCSGGGSFSVEEGAKRSALFYLDFKG